ncbi:uncharacterized protein LAESUDRAFT_5846 [Laetiporus sulphureus 93-53]|uniref:Galactose oxidase n=1 Tax=Laetiporus sulphureus 93-53 TaxID=1314785 RepID=A0A165I464_9APHY|nr:uncharacterized protein LAESUDRAFT_5846 [Laetiporus sulphureus 93-53]KZT12572.1 hypothetical protein LAESUDRAFT_5846 [Laetiporus sulphureus 93-53]
MICSRRCFNVYTPWILSSFLLWSVSHAQRISTSGPVPPLQWINLTNYLTGQSAPPGLIDASIGYNEATRTLLIFGGESAQGIKQSRTYLLNLDSMEWTSPDPPDGLTSTPPARSAAISGYDLASSYRSAHIIIGGNGTNGEALSDVWEFDYTSTFWSPVNISPGGPSGLYGAVGGIDTRTMAVTVANSPYPNNSFYVAGGTDGTTVFPLSNIWRLTVTGVLSSNNPNGSYGSWENISLPNSNLPSKVGAAGAVISQTAQQIAAIGGCDASVPFTPSASCAEQDAYIINTQEDTSSTASDCPAPRLGGTVVPDFNQNSSDFTEQIFLLLGLFDTSLWSDDGGLQRGEVDVLRIDTGEWSRVLPAGDPGTTGGTPAYPTPRSGAVGLSYQETLVGSPRSKGSDTIIFGGVDASGNYLSEVWILRAYNAQLTYSNETWSGYVSGELVGGPNATGQGVTIEYMTACASPLSPKATQTSTYGPSPTTTGSASPTSPTSTTRYDTSVIHRALSPISIAVVIAAVIFARLSSSSVNAANTKGHATLLYSSIILGLAAYGLGIAGLVTSFTSATVTSTLMKRSSNSSTVLKTPHGRAGLALFIAFYGLLPILYAFKICYKHLSSPPNAVKEEKQRNGRLRMDSAETAEKEVLYPGRAGSPDGRNGDARSSEARPLESRQRVRSWGGLSSLPFAGRRSSDSGVDSTGASSPSRSFEVTNRPVRTRRASGNSLAAFSDPRSSGGPRNLSDMSWFEGRRSMPQLGLGDYALVNHRAVDPSTPGTTALDMTSTSGLMTPAEQVHIYPEMPSTVDGILHILFHILLLGLCILSLVALYLRAPLAGFIIFLIGTVVFYIFLIALSWCGKPRKSVLSAVIARLRGVPTHPQHSPSNASPSRATSTVGLEVPCVENRGPYQHHQPPFRTTMSVGLDDYATSHGHGTTEVEEEDEEDEDTRQHRIEEEMSRRDVSIVTVPKRKLFLTNPEVNRG